MKKHDWTTWACFVTLVLYWISKWAGWDTMRHALGLGAIAILVGHVARRFPRE